MPNYTMNTNITRGAATSHHTSNSTGMCMHAPNHATMPAMTMHI